MFNKEEIKFRKNQSNTNVTNQFKISVSNFKEKKQTKTWPKAFNPFVSNQKTFPKSWSRFSLTPAY